MVFEKPKLFVTQREFFIAMLLLALVIAVRLGWIYRDYRSFVSQPFIYTHARIVLTYPKTRHGRTYAVLKLRDDHGCLIYTTAYRQDYRRGMRLYVQLLPGAKIGFGDYLGGMYCKSRIVRVEGQETGVRSRLERWVARQHTLPTMQAFYNGIFWASPIPKDLREPIARLGVSHLVALSGFHLGILWGVLYGMLLWIYRPMQQRYFPWRLDLTDVGMAVMVLLGLYLWVTDFPPSLVRSYAMLLVGWGMVLMGIELMSFEFLATITAALLALFPPLIVSLGFWLSIIGVFYIFLVLSHCQERARNVIATVCIPVGIFLLMQPLVHGIFGVTTAWQLVSPLLSLGFIVFYPLSMVLHLVGYGGILDGMLTALFSLPQSSSEQVLPWWSVLGYVLFSLAAIWYRWAMGVVLGIAIGYAVYLFG